MQLGKPEKEIVMIRSVVDKDAWRARLKSRDRSVCAPLGMWKRLLSTYCLRRRGTPVPEEREVVSLAVTDRVRILGFVNDSQFDPLPACDPGADVQRSSCPLERCGHRTIGNDRSRRERLSGYPYPCEDEDTLAALLSKILCDPALLGYMKEGVAHQMESRTEKGFWTSGWVPLRRRNDLNRSRLSKASNANMTAAIHQS